MKNLVRVFIIFNLLINFSYAQENQEGKKGNEEDQKETEGPSKEKEKINWSSPKLYNIRISPLNLLLGTISGTADFKLRSDLSAGPSLSIFSLTVGETTVSSFSFGAEAVYATSGDIEKKGWIGSAYANYGTFSIKETYSSTNYESSVSILTLGGLYGYQWVWEKVNVQTGAGLTFYSGASTIELESSSGQTRSIANPVGSGITLGLKFTVGYRF